MAPTAVPKLTRRVLMNVLGLGAVSLVSLAGAGCGHSRGALDPVLVQALANETAGVVAVAVQADEGGQPLTLCSGALVAPNLVLTARHCISRAVTATPSCDARGQSHNGAHLAEDADPGQIWVYVGKQVKPDLDAPIARATRTIHPAGHVLCDADVAFVVLDRPVTQIAVLPMRLTAPVESGDTVVPIGFGGGRENVVGRRVAREPSTVLAIGPMANHRTGAVLGPREFEVDKATCRGDSGGPAIDARTGEIVGVVSRGGSCTAQGNHVYTRIDAYARLAESALNAASRSERETAMRPALPPPR